MFLSEWREFPLALCLARNKNFMTFCSNGARRLVFFISAPVTRKDLQFGT